MFDKTIKIEIDGVPIILTREEVKRHVLNSIEYTHRRRRWEDAAAIALINAASGICNGGTSDLGAPNDH